MPQPIRTAISGIAGYAGAELARILLAHPQAAPPLLLGRIADEQGPTPLEHLHPNLARKQPLPLIEPFSWQLLAERKIEVVFLALPHEQSHQQAPEYLAHNIKVIDLSGAWRLQNPTNAAVYNLPPNPLQTEAIYGSPELHREKIRTAKLIANPGCYSTSIILALAPLLRAGLVDLAPGIICDSKSGISGAGKTPSPKTHFMYAADNLSAYSVFGHRHTGELLEQLNLLDSQIQFTPHLLPIPRGILSTIYVKLLDPTTPAAVEKHIMDFYASSPLVRVRPAGTLPDIHATVHTSFCDIGFQLAPDGKRLVLVSTLDNLLKGAASQAVQNMNLMYGFKEEEGLA